MRKLITYLFIIFSVLVKSNTYYISPTGNDAHSGAISSPWLSWQKAATEAHAGDTVFARGGIWYVTGTTSVAVFSNDGTYGNPICFFNYPGENPIIDGRLRIDMLWNGCFSSSAHDYLSFRGIEIRNFFQGASPLYHMAFGIGFSDCTNLTFENMKVHNIGGAAFFNLGAWRYPASGYPWNTWYDAEVEGYYYPKHATIPGDTTRYINCDAYNCCDTFPTEGVNEPGNMADGFKMHNEPGAFIEVRGCRTWNCSDDGFDGSGGCEYYYYNNWSINNGHLNGDGTGYKFQGGFSTPEFPNVGVKRVFVNNIAAFNTQTGFNETIGADETMDENVMLYNNTAYMNDRSFVGNWTKSPIATQIYRNNIRYAARETGGVDAYGLTDYTHDHNSWDAAVTVTDADFITIDSTGITGSRQSNNDLPLSNFLRIAEGSDLIEAGTTVDLSGSGLTFDLFEGTPNIGYTRIAGEAPVITQIYRYKIGNYWVKSGNYFIKPRE